MMTNPYNNRGNNALPRLFLCGLSLVLLLTLTYCRNIQAGTNQQASLQKETYPCRAVPNIPSAKEQLTQIIPLAEIWESDAKFSYYTADLQLDMYHSAAFGFDSATKSMEGYLIYLYYDGRIKKQKVEYEIPEAGEPIIYDNEWPIDSPQALNLLWQQVPVSIQNQADFGCSFLELFRKSKEPGAPLYWYLFLSDCGNGHWYYFIDAATGDVVNP